MSLYDEMAADFAQLLAEFGKPVKIRGEDHTALISEPSTDLGLEIGGLDFKSRFTAKLLRSAITRMPQSGDEFLYNNTRHHVRTVVDRPPHPIVILEVVL
jgi:hypothetical protein